MLLQCNTARAIPRAPALVASKPARRVRVRRLAARCMWPTVHRIIRDDDSKPRSVLHVSRWQQGARPAARRHYPPRKGLTHGAIPRVSVYAGCRAAIIAPLSYNCHGLGPSTPRPRRLSPEGDGQGSGRAAISNDSHNMHRARLVDCLQLVIKLLEAHMASPVSLPNHAHISP